jgi:RNA polymerase-binding transcription factor DksA
MAASTKTETTISITSHEEAVKAVMEQLRNNRSANTKSLLSRVEDLAVDVVADSAEFGSRIAAGAVSAYDSGLDTYAAERERQLRRRAEKALARVVV